MVEVLHAITTDNVYLSALLYGKNKSETAVIFVHGFISDFYTWPFVERMGEKCADAGLPFLAVQTRGSGCVTEVSDLLLGKEIFLGSYYELLEDAYLDIDAWISVLKKQGFTRFILIGHSLGTIKVMRYLFEGTYRTDIVKVSLMGPFDKNAFMQQKVGEGWHDYVESVKTEIDEGHGNDIVPSTHEDYPMSLQTFYSWYRVSDINEMWDFYRIKQGFTFPIWKQVTVPVQVVTGTSDGALAYPDYYSRIEAYDQIRKMIGNADLVLVENSDHCFVGYEESVAREVASFVTA